MTTPAPASQATRGRTARPTSTSARSLLARTAATAGTWLVVLYRTAMHRYSQVAGYTCDCTGTGYRGRDCEVDVDECNNYPCGQERGTCVNLHNNYECRCHAGFTGRNCEININECEPRPCLNNATCVDGVDDFSCSCMRGYSGKECSYVY